MRIYEKPLIHFVRSEEIISITQGTGFPIDCDGQATCVGGGGGTQAGWFCLGGGLIDVAFLLSNVNCDALPNCTFELDGTDITSSCILNPGTTDQCTPEGCRPGYNCTTSCQTDLNGIPIGTLTVTCEGFTQTVCTGLISN
jgi:hypothetical protein